MSKASALTTLVMLAGFGALFLLADATLKPLAQDGQVGQDLTRHLETLGEVEPGSRVRVLRIPASPARADRPEPGLRIRLEPSTSVCRRPQGLARLARAAAQEALDAYAAGRTGWVEVLLEVEEEGAPRTLDLVLEVRSTGLEALGKGLPATWPPPEAAAAAARRPAR